MKKFFGYLLFFALCIGLYKYCTGDSDKSDAPKVMKQVRVAAKVANLRTGPGTNYDCLTVNADGTGGKWQVTSGTVLDVLKEKKGWYQVRVGDDPRTAYIKQTLCAELNDKSGSRKSRRGSSSSRSSSSGSSSSSASSGTPSTDGVSATPAPSVPPAEEEVVEITSGRASQDEVIF